MVVTDYAPQPIDLENAVKIGEGKYREVYRVGNFAIKMLKHSVRKNYGFFHVDFPSQWYTKHKFGIKDFNQFEYDMFREFIERVPVDFRDRFAHIHSVGKIDGKSYSLSDLAINGDGNPSKTLAQYGEIGSYNFWSQIEELEGVLTDNSIPIMDIRGENIMVQETSEGVAPVFIDFKRYGGRTYSVQFWLSSEKQLVAKMQRRFERLRELYKPS
jgi:hypothetical protein